ncbi:MsnO8 family LLM class oxidoreductase [Alterisphingorhabdus coralli]|uniref:MsnO8 family LLM class oxidoreductase n=1 Tax=Alterisphingorhabdus coralli TaxID=3071408 RepID=A0AA97F6G7_9SPHN|nr:MsnO8 family LLM class oxidoreductase [Parasphingorhabdus sp. SCSIO 66989]WOE75086.1 MsnO8 family LLM class oxidoreductase [Parasphingorhabdus sp. SCSIO 66989]
MTKIRLSIIDQSLRSGDAPASEAFADSIAVARLADRLGYYRYWVSEHHANPSICGSVPELLLTAIGAQTGHIRLGTGGIMLPHYSAYRVAEIVSTLSNLYPGRIDAGLGRAPGGDVAVSYALAQDRRPQFEKFAESLQILRGYLQGEIQHPMLVPEPVTPIPLHILGTSPHSAVLAGQMGMPYAIGRFINPQAGSDLAARYRDHFVPAHPDAQPHVILATTALAAEDSERAELLRKNVYVNFVHMLLKSDGKGLRPPEDTQDYSFDEAEALAVGRQARIAAFGTGEEVVEKLHAMAQDFTADEIMFTCNTYHLADRLASLQLIAEAAGMDGTANGGNTGRLFDRQRPDAAPTTLA